LGYIRLAGPKYDPAKDMVSISCFEVCARDATVPGETPAAVNVVPAPETGKTAPAPTVNDPLTDKAPEVKVSEPPAMSSESLLEDLERRAVRTIGLGKHPMDTCGLISRPNDSQQT
jgi:hypothetical protein